MTNKIVKELRETNSAMRDLLAAKRDLTTLLLLDDQLLKLELEMEMMDGIKLGEEKAL